MKKSWGLFVFFCVVGGVLWKLRNAQKSTQLSSGRMDSILKKTLVPSPKISQQCENMFSASGTAVPFDKHSPDAFQADFVSTSNITEVHLQDVDGPEPLVMQNMFHPVHGNTQEPRTRSRHFRHWSTLLRPARRYQHNASHHFLLPKPALCCERYGMAWKIILTGVTGVATPNLHRVNAPKTNRRGALVVTEFPVSIQHGSAMLTFPAHSDRILVFRLYGNRGRCVETAQGDGPYLLVVPVDYRVESPSQIIPQTVFIEGFQGWFIEAIVYTKILDANQQIIREWLDNAIHPELRGDVLAEASESAVPWFLEEPNIQGSWNGTRKIVMGLEQGAESWWARQEVLFSEGMRPELPRIQTGTGWYFVRFYDSNDQLLSSLSFRWARDLRDVVSKHDDTGTLVTFQHRGHLQIHPQGDSPDIVLIRDDSQRCETTYHISFGPQWDHSAWTIEDVQDRSSVVMPLRLRRVYWTVKKEGETETQTHWVNHPISLPKTLASLSSDWLLWLNTGGESCKVIIRGGRNHVTLQSSKEGELLFP